MQGQILRTFVAAMALGCTASAWSLDLAESYRLAAARDAAIRGSRSAADAARERLPQARAQLLPTVSISASRFRNSLDSTSPNLLGQPVTTHDFYESMNDTLSIRQPLYRKALTANYDQAKAVVADVNAQLERDEQSLVMKVAQAYFEALHAEEQVVLIGLTKAQYTGQADAARKAFAAGAGTRTDIDEAQARLDMTIAQELEARQNVELTRRQLQVLIGQPVVGPLAKVNVGKLQLNNPVPASAEEWTMLAESTSPELVAARAQIDSARSEVEKARAGHMPTLDLVAQASRSTSENVTRINSRYIQKQIGVQLNIPIYQGGMVNSQVREALAQLERTENRLDELRRDLGVRVHREFKGVSEGVLKVRALEQAVRSAEQLVVSSRRSFEAGARTRIDILNAEQAAGQMRRDLSQARLAYLLAIVRLKALTGTERVANIVEVNAWLEH